MVIAVALSREQDMANSLVATRLQALRWNLTVFPCNTPATNLGSKLYLGQVTLIVHPLEKCESR